MDDQQQKATSTARTRRKLVSSIAPCRDEIRGVQISNRSSNQTVIGYCPAVKRRQCQQRAFISKLEIPVRETRLDKQGHQQARVDSARGTSPYLLHSQRQNAQRGGVVCRDVDTVTPSPRYGLWRAGIAKGGVRTVGRKDRRTGETFHIVKIESFARNPYLEPPL